MSDPLLSTLGRVAILLAKKGYQYGQDATENVAVGYELAMEELGAQYRADMAELEYWRRWNADMMHVKSRVDGTTHADRIAHIRGGK